MEENNALKTMIEQNESLYKENTVKIDKKLDECDKLQAIIDHMNETFLKLNNPPYTAPTTSDGKKSKKIYKKRKIYKKK